MLQEDREQFDVVIVGAGSTGGVVASRLSEDPGRTVLLLEAGPDFPHAVEAPPEFFRGLPPTEWGEIDWGYESEFLPGGRRIALRRGRLVGGTSMTNGCIAARGRPDDFRGWVAAGAVGWGWQQAEAAYEQVEREVPITHRERDSWPINQATLGAAFEHLGYTFAGDLNGAHASDGVFGPWPRNILDGVRQGTLMTYLATARHRPNLVIRPHVLVDRVMFDRDRATGVRYIDSDGRPGTVRATQVVLSAGAYGSPSILLRSGIGPSTELQRLGVDVVGDLPVGRGLMDHPAMTFPIEIRQGVGTSEPDFASAVRGPGWWATTIGTVDQNIWALTFCLALRDGDGSVRLASTNPNAAPLIDHRYQAITATRLFEGPWEMFRELLTAPPMRAVDARTAVMTSIKDFTEANVRSGYHPAGGCRIGTVVDANLAVFGVDRLFVADASVFPLHVSNNPNWTCLMVGERFAAKIGAEPERVESSS